MNRNASRKSIDNHDLLFHIFTAFYRTGWEYTHGPFETNYMRGLYPLAAVCRTWRAAVKEHFLLKQLVLEITKPPRRGRHASYFHELFSGPGVVQRNMEAYGHIKTMDSLFIYHTNAYLIPYANNRVSTIYIYLGNNVTTNDLLTGLEQIRFEKFRWPEVTALHVVTDRMYVPGVANTDAIREPLYHKLNSIGVAVDWIFRAAPRINSVRLGSRAQLPYPMQIPLQASIMDNIGQLERLELSNQFCSFTIPPLFPPLTVLSISPVHHSLGFVLAKIPTHCLKKLRLYQITPTHFFQAIGIQGPGAVAEFPELLHLDLQFTAISSSDADNDEWFNNEQCGFLQFPRLLTVSVHDYYYNIAGIFNCFLQSPMHTLYLSTHPWVYLNAGVHRLTQLQRLWLTFDVRLGRNLPNDFFQPLLQMPRNAMTELTFYSSQNVISSQLTEVCLRGLRTLDVDIKLGYMQVIGLMQQLPKLISLRFILDITSVDRAEPALSLYRRMLPVCSHSVQHMVVVFNPIVTELGNEPASLAVLDNLLVLVAHMPGLCRLRTCFTVALFKAHLKRAMHVQQFAAKTRHLLQLKYTSRREC
ncbi:hypothetical protein GGF40_001762 [Coemansia sp. RSA 1286]|nr:hypothetical protein GGF40_001762 [Coemansia sp. RSA 1286]